MEKMERATAQSGTMMDVLVVIRNVQLGIRTKADLKRCGCSVCRDALKIMEQGGK